MRENYGDVGNVIVVVIVDVIIVEFVGCVCFYCLVFGFC